MIVKMKHTFSCCSFSICGLIELRFVDSRFVTAFAENVEIRSKPVRPLGFVWRYSPIVVVFRPYFQCPVEDLMALVVMVIDNSNGESTVIKRA